MNEIAQDNKESTFLGIRLSNFEQSTWSLISGGITAPNGFKASGIRAGLKNSGNKLDLALILAPKNSLCSGTFTQSLIRADCIDLCMDRLFKTAGRARAILINSGQANACTGKRGFEDNIIATQALAEKLGISVSEVLICSTGVIGQPIRMQNLLKGLDSLINSLSDEGSGFAAKAILTTDLIEKEIAIEGYLGGRRIRIGGIAKGSGMIHPNMATMLAFLSCDVGLPKKVWDAMIQRVVKSSFNAISVDGDTSTNDSFLAFCGGEDIDKEYFDEVEMGLEFVATSLAKSIARDGEGSNCLIEVKVKGAKSLFDAQIISRTICSSSLVKTAIHGCDPNWGRILAAAGRSGITFSPEEISLWIGSFQIMKKGLPIEFDRNSVVSYMKDILKVDHDKKETLFICLSIGNGPYEALAWGCDLSSEYIRINADYTT